MGNASHLLDRMAAALGKSAFKVSRNVELSDGKKADVAASRTYFSWKGLVILSQHVVVREVDDATQDDLKALFGAAFRFGKRANWVPLFRGLQFGYMVMPVLVGESPDAALAQAVSRCPPKHWSLFEYPVVVDLSANQAHYFRGTATWGAFFFSDMRKVADTYINGSLPITPDARDGS